MEMCNAHSKVQTTAALSDEVEDAAGLINLEAGVGKISKRGEKHYSIKVVEIRFHAHLSSSVKDRICQRSRGLRLRENLGQEVTDDDKLTRIKKGLTDNEYIQ